MQYLYKPASACGWRSVWPNADDKDASIGHAAGPRDPPRVRARSFWRAKADDALRPSGVPPRRRRSCCMTSRGGNGAGLRAERLKIRIRSYYYYFLDGGHQTQTQEIFI